MRKFRCMRQGSRCSVVLLRCLFHPLPVAALTGFRDICCCISSTVVPHLLELLMLQCVPFCLQRSCPSARVAHLLSTHFWSSTCVHYQLLSIVLLLATSFGVLTVSYFSSFQLGCLLQPSLHPTFCVMLLFHPSPRLVEVLPYCDHDILLSCCLRANSAAVAST